METQTAVPQVSQESAEQELGLQVGVSPTSQETEVVVPPVSQESAETEVETQVAVPSVSQKCPEQEVGTWVGFTPVTHGGPEPEIVIDTSEIQGGDDTSVSSVNLKREMEENALQKRVYLIDENDVRENEVYPNIVPMICDFLRPIFDEARREILQQMRHHQNIYIVAMIFYFLQQILEDARREILEQMRQNIVPVASEFRTSLEEDGREISEQRHYNIMPKASAIRPRAEILQQRLDNILPMEFEFLRSSREESRTEILFQILSVIVEQTRFINANIYDPTVIIYEEFTASHRNMILPLLCRMQFGTTSRLLLVGPSFPLLALVASAPLLALRELRRLLGLEDIRNLQALGGSNVQIPIPLLTLVASAPLLFLRGLRSLIGLEDISNLPALEGPHLSELESTQRLSSLGQFPLLSLQKSPSLSLLPEARNYLSEKSEMCSNLEKGKGLELREPTDLSSVRPPETAEVLALCPRKPMKEGEKKHKQRTESSKPGNADFSLNSVEYKDLLEYENQQIKETGEPEFSNTRDLQKLLEYGNEEFSDPGDPDNSDPIELLKDLNFGKMKTVNEEMEPAGNLELEPIEMLRTKAEKDFKSEASRDLETEDDCDLNTEDSGDFKIEASEDLETESRGDLEKRSGEDLKKKVEGDLKTEAEDLETDDDEDLEENYENLGIEVCEPLLPPAQLPHEDVIEIPDEPEEFAPNEALPNDEGHPVFIRNGICRDGEVRAELERLEAELREDEMKEFIICIILWIMIVLVLGNVLYILSYVYDWRGLRTQNETTPIPDIDSNTATSIDNTTSLN